MVPRRDRGRWRRARHLGGANRQVHGEAMIEGVKITPLRQILDERGKIMHMLRSDDPHLKKIDKIYFSCVHPGAIKGWHIHKKKKHKNTNPHNKNKNKQNNDQKDSPT